MVVVEVVRQVVELAVVVRVVVVVVMVEEGHGEGQPGTVGAHCGGSGSGGRCGRCVAGEGLVLVLVLLLGTAKAFGHCVIVELEAIVVEGQEATRWRRRR